MDKLKLLNDKLEADGMTPQVEMYALVALAEDSVWLAFMDRACSTPAQQSAA